METLPWYKSAIVRQQIVQLVAALVAIIGINTEGIDLDATVASIFAGIAAVIAVWTLLTRIFRPAPNLSQTAADKERALVAAGTIPAQNPKERGFVKGFVLLVLLGVSFAAAVTVSVTGCASTQAAYEYADSVPETAYVVAEHYSAVLKEAADLAQLPGTPADVKEALKAADREAKQLILGDPVTGLPSLRELAANYKTVRDAKTEMELQAALDRAVLSLARFITAVKTARR